jgi:hypothetical protein
LSFIVLFSLFSGLFRYHDKVINLLARIKKRITYLYGNKNLISILEICDPISKKHTCILSPIDPGAYYPYFCLYVFHIRPTLFSHWKLIFAKYLWNEISTFTWHMCCLFLQIKLSFIFKWINWTFNFATFFYLILSF